MIKDLPRLGPELVLFFTAGILGSGLSSLVTGWDLSLAGTFHPLLLVCAGLAAILAAAAVGIHPVVGVIVVSGLVSNLRLPADLLAMSFLFGWGIGVVINPISGVHMLLSGRYAYPNENAWRWNLPFAAVSYFLSCAWFFLFYMVT